MQRELKFRAWDKQNKSMEEVELLGDEVLRIKHAEWENREDFEVMQYTGLKDRKGVEIYEGDIIEIVNNLNEVTKKTNTHNAIVKYKEGSLVATWQDEFVGEIFNYFNSYNTPIVTFEVIGNIYENPRLLKDGGKIKYRREYDI